MSKQDNGFSRREMSGLTIGLRLKRGMLFGIAAMLMGASLFFTWSTSAHNIDLAKARDVAREYARKVRDESGGKYLHYSTSCKKAFPGHNHVVYCTIDYQNATDTEKGVYTCRETIQIFMWSHDRDGAGNFDLYGSHRSKFPCGKIYLHETYMAE
jgi:hypothetical protein